MKRLLASGIAAGAIVAGLSIGASAANAAPATGLPLVPASPADVASAGQDVGFSSLSASPGGCSPIDQLAAGSSGKIG